MTERWKDKAAFLLSCVRSRWIPAKLQSSTCVGATSGQEFGVKARESFLGWSLLHGKFGQRRAWSEKGTRQESRKTHTWPTHPICGCSWSSVVLTWKQTRACLFTTFSFFSLCIITLIWSMSLTKYPASVYGTISVQIQLFLIICNMANYQIDFFFSSKPVMRGQCWNVWLLVRRSAAVGNHVDLNKVKTTFLTEKYVF